MKPIFVSPRQRYPNATSTTLTAKSLSYVYLSNSFTRVDRFCFIVLQKRVVHVRPHRDLGRIERLCHSRAVDGALDHKAAVGVEANRLGQNALRILALLGHHCDLLAHEEVEALVQRDDLIPGQAQQALQVAAQRGEEFLAVYRRISGKVKTNSGQRANVEKIANKNRRTKLRDQLPNYKEKNK